MDPPMLAHKLLRTYVIHGFEKFHIIRPLLLYATRVEAPNVVLAHIHGLRNVFISQNRISHDRSEPNWHCSGPGGSSYKIKNLSLQWFLRHQYMERAICTLQFPSSVKVVPFIGIIPS